MASLYIKNPETADLAQEVANLLGTTKTAAVHDALLQRKRALNASIHDRLRAWRAAHPLGEPTGLEADKAFYDSLYDEGED